MVGERNWDRSAAESVRDFGGRDAPIRDAQGFHPGGQRDYHGDPPEYVPQKVTWGEAEAIRAAIEACGHGSRPYWEPWWLRPEAVPGSGIVPVAQGQAAGALSWTADAAGQGEAVRFSLFFPGPRLAVAIWEGRPSDGMMARRRNKAHERGVAVLDVVRGAGLPMAQDVADALGARDRKAQAEVPPEPVPAPPEQGIEGSGVASVRDRDALGGTGLAAVVRPKPED